VFSAERNPITLVAAFIASAAIAWSHLHRTHFHIAPKTMPFIVWAVVAFPVMGLITKQLLLVWHPVALELFRDAALAITLAPLFYRYSRKISRKAFWFLVLTSFLASVSFILYDFSIQRSGIIYSTLIFALQPLLVYFGSLVFLKERFQWKKMVAFVVVLVSIIVAQVSSGIVAG
jgi:drug/metabolite transporter (DMT)-like permease